MRHMINDFWTIGFRKILKGWKRKAAGLRAVLGACEGRLRYEDMPYRHADGQYFDQQLSEDWIMVVKKEHYLLHCL